MYIKVRAKTKAKKEELVVKKPDHFEVSVKEKAERNMANERIIELVASHFVIPVGKVRIVSGHHSPSKILSVEV